MGNEPDWMSDEVAGVVSELTAQVGQAINRGDKEAIVYIMDSYAELTKEHPESALVLAQAAIFMAGSFALKLFKSERGS
jgi:hypothetical protein